VRKTYIAFTRNKIVKTSDGQKKFGEMLV